MPRLATLKPRVQVAVSSRVTIAAPRSSAPDYRIRGRRLQAIREAHFRQHPLCVHCLAQGRVSAATDLDHVVALINGGGDTEANRQGLCHACHETKTIEDLRTAGVR